MDERTDGRLIRRRDEGREQKVALNLTLFHKGLHQVGEALERGWCE